MKHEIPTEEYQQKLQARIASFMDQSITQPVLPKQNKTSLVLAGAALTLFLAIGLYLYSQQDNSQLPGTVAEPSDKIETNN